MHLLASHLLARAAQQRLLFGPLDTESLAIVLRRKAEVIFRQLTDRAVLLDGPSGKCFELNRLGAEIWYLLDGERTLEEVCGHLHGTGDVPAQRLRSDVRQFARELEAVGLAERRS